MLGNLPMTLFGGLVTGEAMQWVSQAKRKAVFFGIAALLAFTAWLLLVTAGVVAIAEQYGLLVASLAGAGAMVVLALLTIATLKIMEWYHRRKARETNSRAALLTTGAAMALPPMMRYRPILTLVLVGVGGLVASHYLAEKTLRQ